ncbi:MAG TPA: oligosaccharide flippase family protein [Polyangia bacterium]|nr:oligosaccharide flippase family protein [Polyangia bacterium]
MAQSSALKTLAVQASHYSVASLFGVIAGLVTFPLLTRVFSVADYGVMNLVAATLTVSVAVGKVGVQHSILRYESEIRAGKGRYTMPELYSTTQIGMLCTAAFVMLVVGVGAYLVPLSWLGDGRVRKLFSIASFLIVVQVAESAFINFLRAEQKTTLLMKYNVAKKYLGLGLILVAVLWLSSTLASFYTATLVSEATAVAALAVVLYRTGSRPLPALAQFSRPLYRELLSFGIPMMIGYELSSIVLAVGDRYVIAGLIGKTPLGLYGAAYNLCQYVQAVVITSVGQAVMPIYIKMWDEKGPAETSAFITRSLRTYALMAAPVVAGVAAVGPELLPALASEKYASAAPVLSWVIAGMAVDGANSMMGAGLFIHRKTRVIMAIVLSCAVLNIGLNLALVPRVGIVGSAIATLVSYSVAAFSLATAGRRLLRVAIPWTTVLRAGLGAGFMYVVVTHVLPGHRLFTVAARIALGAPLYVVLMTLVDADARALVRRSIARLRGSRGMGREAP